MRLFLVLFFSLNAILIANAQQKKDYWISASTLTFNDLDNSRSSSGNVFSREFNYSNTNIEGGIFLMDKLAWTGHLNWQKGDMDFTTTRLPFLDNGESLDINTALRAYYWRSKKRIFFAGEIGCTLQFNQVNNKDYDPIFVQYSSPPKVRLLVELSPIVGFQLREDLSLLFQLQSNWGQGGAILSLSSYQSQIRFLRDVGLKIGFEYYLSASPKQLTNSFNHPYQQKRRYWELDGNLFSNSLWKGSFYYPIPRNGRHGLDLNLTYGIQYSNAINVAYWIRVKSDFWQFPFWRQGEFGASIHKAISFKNRPHTYQIFGGSITTALQDGDGFGVIPLLEAGIEHWMANRLRIRLTTSAGIDFHRLDLGFYDNSFLWRGNCELEYFTHPKFSWAAAYRVPIYQSYFGKPSNLNADRYETWNGNGLRLAARFWM